LPLILQEDKFRVILKIILKNSLLKPCSFHKQRQASSTAQFQQEAAGAAE
jgi:hypothetical protein